VKAATIDICALADYSVWLKDRQHMPRVRAGARWADEGGGDLWGRWANVVKLGQLGWILWGIQLRV
jgi:hypothetical protein